MRRLISWLLIAALQFMLVVSPANAFAPVGVIAGNNASAPLYRTAAPSSDTTGTNHTIQMPSGIVSGDYLYAYSVNTAATTLSASGWTQITGSGNLSTTLFYRKADGTEGASMTFTTAASSGLDTVVVRVSGANATTPHDVATWTTLATIGATSVAAPDVTTSVPNTLLLQFFSAYYGAPSGGESMTLNNSVTKVSDYSALALIGAAVKTLASSGATGVTTATLSASGTYRAAISLVIKP